MPDTPLIQKLKEAIVEVLFEAYTSPRATREAYSALNQLCEMASHHQRTTMKQVIRKFPVPSLLGNSPAIQMPASAQILSVAPHVTATTDAAVFALVNEAEPIVNRTILFLQTDVATSQKPMAFIGTVVLAQSAIHFFDMGET